MLDLAADALKRLEEAGRAALEEAESKAGNLRAEGVAITADFEAAKGLAAAKQEECDAKGAEVERLRGEEEAAKVELADMVKAKEAFFVEKAQLIADQEAFQKVLDEMWQPLKAASFLGQQWRKRDKVLDELIEKLKPLGLNDSLIEALLAAFKLRLDQRTAFAQKAFECGEEAFEKHKASLGERIAGTTAEEEAREKSVTEAEAKVTSVHSKFIEQDKEYDELQNGWAELKTTSNEAQSAAAAFETEVQAALEDVEARKADLDAAMAVAASFVTLREAPPQPQPAIATEEPSEAVAEPEMSMEAEPEVVAVAA